MKESETRWVVQTKSLFWHPYEVGGGESKRFHPKRIIISSFVIEPRQHVLWI